MPTKRVKRAPQRIAISPAAIAAWRAGDFGALMRALDIGPHEPSPWPLEVTLLGCSQEPYESVHPWDANPAPWKIASWQRAQQLQRALLEVSEPGAMDRRGRPLGRKA